MKTHIFALGAIPGVDEPLLRKSKFYVDDMLRRGEVRMLPESSYHRPAAEMLRRRAVEHDQRTAASGISDWANIQASYLPKHFDSSMPEGGLLMITTKQLLTPKEKRQNA